MKIYGDLKHGIINMNQLKIIALIAMTIDHIGAKLFHIDGLTSLSTIMCIVGRTAAPLFVFALAVGMRKTHSKAKYILRLYIANIIISITAIPFILTGVINTAPSILSTLLYIAVIIYIIEFIKERTHRWLITAGITIPALSIIILVPIIINRTVESTLVDKTYTLFGSEPAESIRGVLRAIIPSIWLVDYSMLFVLMGVAFYFLKNKYAQAAALFIFSAISYMGTYRLAFTMFNGFFLSNQFLMLLAIPVILLYNGEKGHNMKWLFYIYYPAHIYIISIISRIM